MMDYNSIADILGLSSFV